MFIDIKGFKVIYQDIVYKGLHMMMDFGEKASEQEFPRKPKFLEVVVIDSDGQPLILRDETFMFQLIREINC